MKLNLLPTYVGRGKQLAVSIVLGVMMILVCFGISFVMVKSAQAQLDDVTAQAKAFEPKVDESIAYSNKVDGIVAPLHDLVRNINLANEMQAHNTVFPDFYDKVTPYIPNFYRITSMQATPSDAANCTLRLSGVLKTRDEYHELLLALLRIPGATSVVRSGFTEDQPPFLGNVTSNTPNPQIVDADHPQLSNDPLANLNAKIAAGNQREPGPQGNWGLGKDLEKGPMPHYQAVTVAITMPGALQTPNPSATLGVTGAGGGGGGGGGKRGGGGGGRGGGAGGAAVG